jgi:hypothetical protein
VCAPPALSIQEIPNRREIMEGYVQDSYPLWNDSTRTHYIHTRDVDRLMHPEAVLCETQEELEVELKKRYPDIEEGYGQVLGAVVYNTPGLITRSYEIAERVCKKYGKIPNHIYFQPYGLSGFIADPISIRYDDKIKRNREKAKAKPTKRNSVYLRHVVQFLSSCSYDSKYPMIRQCLETCHINLGTGITGHARTYFLAQMIMAATDDGKALKCGTFKGLQEKWAKSVADPKLTDYNALKTLEILDTILSIKENPATLAG